MESAAVEVEQLEAAFQSLEVEACQPLWVVKDEVSTKEAAPRAEKTHKEVREADCDPEVEGKDQFEGGGPSKEMNEDDKGNKDAAESERKQKEHWLRVDVCHATVGVAWECSCCVFVRSQPPRTRCPTVRTWKLWSGSAAWPGLPKRRRSRAGLAFEKPWKASSRPDRICFSSRQSRSSRGSLVASRSTPLSVSLTLSFR